MTATQNLKPAVGCTSSFGSNFVRKRVVRADVKSVHAGDAESAPAKQLQTCRVPRGRRSNLGPGVRGSHLSTRCAGVGFFAATHVFLLVTKSCTRPFKYFPRSVLHVLITSTAMLSFRMSSPLPASFPCLRSDLRSQRLTRSERGGWRSVFLRSSALFILFAKIIHKEQTFNSIILIRALLLFSRHSRGRLRRGD